MEHASVSQLHQDYFPVRMAHEQTDITGRRENVLQQTVKTHGGSLAHPKGELIPLTLDATDKSSIQQLVSELSKREKHIDVLVNNAGISKGKSEVEKGDESVMELSKELFGEGDQEWMDVYRTNVMGYVYSCHFASILPLIMILDSSSLPQHSPHFSLLHQRRDQIIRVLLSTLRACRASLARPSTTSSITFQNRLRYI